MYSQNEGIIHWIALSAEPQMVTFVASLRITAFGVMSFVGAAAHHSLSKESSLQSPPLREPRAMTERLNIFESFAKSEDQRHGHLQLSVDSVEPDQDCFGSDDGKTVNEILQDSLVELERDYRQLIPTEFIESLIVFQSLLKMLSMRYPGPPASPLPWQTYLSESIRTLRCLVMDLCHEFGSHFKCDDEGHLNAITLNEMAGRFDHFDLLLIPNTVKMIEMKRTKLKTISEWEDLRGKSLKTLRIHENGVSNLKLNLDGLQGALDYLPLEHLTVGRSEVSDYFGLQTVSLHDPALSRIGEWMSSSTLMSLRIETQRNHKRKVYLQRDGTFELIRVSHIGRASRNALLLLRAENSSTAEGRTPDRQPL